MSNFKKFVIGSIIAIALSFLTITGLFIYNFGNYNLSSQIEHWGAFGDFIGGTLNIVISLVSLVVLGYLTYIVHRESSAQNRKQKILDKRLEIYDEACEKMMGAYELVDKYTIAIKKVIYEDEKGTFDRTKALSEINELTGRMLTITSYINFFDIRYFNLFPISSKSDELEELKKANRKYENYYKKVDRYFQIGSNLPDEKDSIVETNYIPIFCLFILKLSEELK